MADDLHGLLSELWAERYGPTERLLPVSRPLATGGMDDEVSQARRRRVLNESLLDEDPGLRVVGEG